MLIPIFLIKEPSSYLITGSYLVNGKKVKLRVTKKEIDSTYVGFWKSIKISLSNKNFLI
jgi:hypothetical protein